MNVRNRPDQWNILQSLMPDIALLQEWRKPDDFAPSGNLHCVPYLPGRYTAVWSKWPIEDQDNFPRSANIDWGLYRNALDGCVASATITLPVVSLSVTSVYAYPEKIKPEWIAAFDLEALRLPSANNIWPADMVWWALRNNTFTVGLSLLGGDWNTSRIMDDPRPRGNQEFFDRMSKSSWNETARQYYPYEKDSTTWARKGGRPMQLDHFFTSAELAKSMSNFEVVRAESFRNASDHLPILVDFDINER
jgi:hypothetical protein